MLPGNWETGVYCSLLLAPWHGLMPSPGIWKFVGRIAFWTFSVSLVFAAFGKGKWRIFIPIWAVAYAFVVYMIAMLEMD